MNVSIPELRRLLAHAVLAVLLLAGQQHATRHWLSHTIEATQAKATGTPVHTHCDECDGLVAFGAALPTPICAFPPVTDFDNAQVFAASPSAPDTATPIGYLSRAPPTLG